MIVNVILFVIMLLFFFFDSWYFDIQYFFNFGLLYLNILLYSQSFENVAKKRSSYSYIMIFIATSAVSMLIVNLIEFFSGNGSGKYNNNTLSSNNQNGLLLLNIFYVISICVNEICL